MNFKKTAVALAMGMMVSGGAMAQSVIEVPTFGTNFFSSTANNSTFSDIANTLTRATGTTTTTTSDVTETVTTTPVDPDVDPTVVTERVTETVATTVAAVAAANVSVLAASINEADIYGAITIEGATISFSAIENVNATANATSSNIESATATAKAINGNSLSTTVIGVMNTADLENRVKDSLTTDFAAQGIEQTGTDFSDLAALGGTLSPELGTAELVSASVNAGNIAGNIAIVASNTTPTWFLSEAAVASVNLTNLEASTTVIGAMNTTNAISEVMRDVNLKTAIQVVNSAPN